MNIVQNKAEKSLLRNYVTRRMENDVTRRSVQVSRNEPAKFR